MRSLVVLAVLAVVPSAAASVSFGFPAALQADLAWQDAQGLLVVAGNDTLAVTVSAGATVVNEIMDRRSWVVEQHNWGTIRGPLPTPWEEHDTVRLRDDVRFISQPGAMVFLTGTVDGFAANVDGHLTARGLGNCVGLELYKHEDPYRYPPGSCPGGSGADAVGSLTGAVNASGKHAQLVMLGFSHQDCIRCLHGGSTEVTHAEGLQPDDRVTVTKYRFARLSGHDLAVSITGNARAIAVEGSPWNLSAEGHIRLPLAHGPVCPDACFDAGGRSIMIQGAMRFVNLSTSGDRPSSLQADMAGTWLSVRTDETEAWATASDTVVATATLVGLALLVKFAGFVLRVMGRDPLRHPKRASVAEYIREHPGATFRELLRGTGIASGTVRHHVAVLRQHGVIEEYRHLETLRYFERGSSESARWKDIVHLREPELARLHEWLTGVGPSFQKDILAASAAWGWSRSTTQHRLKRLVAGGLISVTDQGRLRRYTVLRGDPSTQPEPPEVESVRAVPV